MLTMSKEESAMGCISDRGRGSCGERVEHVFVAAIEGERRGSAASWACAILSRSLIRRHPRQVARVAKGSGL